MCFAQRAPHSRAAAAAAVLSFKRNWLYARARSYVPPTQRAIAIWRAASERASERRLLEWSSRGFNLGPNSSGRKISSPSGASQGGEANGLQQWSLGRTLPLITAKLLSSGRVIFESSPRLIALQAGAAAAARLGQNEASLAWLGRGQIFISEIRLRDRKMRPARAGLQ